MSRESDGSNTSEQNFDAQKKLQHEALNIEGIYFLPYPDQKTIAHLALYCNKKNTELKRLPLPNEFTECQIFIGQIPRDFKSSTIVWLVCTLLDDQESVLHLHEQEKRCFGCAYIYLKDKKSRDHLLALHHCVVLDTGGAWIATTKDARIAMMQHMADYAAQITKCKENGDDMSCWVLRQGCALVFEKPTKANLDWPHYTTNAYSDRFRLAQPVAAFPAAASDGSSTQPAAVDLSVLQSNVASLANLWQSAILAQRPFFHHFWDGVARGVVPNPFVNCAISGTGAAAVPPASPSPVDCDIVTTVPPTMVVGNDNVSSLFFLQAPDNNAFRIWDPNFVAQSAQLSVHKK